MEILKVEENNKDFVLKKAREVLFSGGIICYPTETFYALGALYNKPDVIYKIYEVKKRPILKTMPLIAGSVEVIKENISNLSLFEEKLAQKYWPGPLTLLLKTDKKLSEYVISGRKVAVRVPGESFALDLARCVNIPITSTSANISGQNSISSISDLESSILENIDLVIDGGQTPGGLASTIYDGEEDVVVRQGVVNLENDRKS